MSPGRGCHGRARRNTRTRSTRNQYQSRDALRRGHDGRYCVRFGRLSVLTRRINGGTRKHLATIGIAAYTLAVREKRDTQHLVLGNLPFGGFHSVLGEFFDSLKKDQVPDDENKLLQSLLRHDRDDGTFTHCGILESGEYGFEAKGIDTKTLKQSYHRRAQDAEMLPFYFAVRAPDEHDGAVVLLQRHGPHGIYAAFKSALYRFCEKRLPKYHLDFGHLVPAEVVAQLKEGGVRSIKVTAYKVPEDMADELKFLGNHPDPGTFSVEIKAKRDGFLHDPGWLKKSRAIVIPDSWGQGKVEVKVSYNGKNRIVALNNPANISPYVDATAELEIEASGHPSYDSIHKYCGGLMKDLLTQLGREHE